MAYQPTRRDLLKASAAAAFGGALIPSALASGGSSQVGKYDKVRCAVIGVGGRGSAHVNAAAKLGEIVALCDIDAERRAKALVEHPRAAVFMDYRRMLDGMHKEIDAVFVATPDHTHAPAAAMAMKLGKATYCEKPLTRTIWEARQLNEIARRERVVTQMGNQGTSSTNLRKVAKLLQQGAFGKVKEVHCWTNRPAGYWAQGIERPETKPEPRTVAWDEWIGPRPFRPYADGYHSFAWRGWWDFGTGNLGDIGCHAMNLPFMGLDLRDPVAIQAETSGHNKDSFPLWAIITYEFPKRGNRDALNLVWYDGGKKPSLDLAPGVDELDANGSLIVCEKATLYSPREYGTETRILGSDMAMPEVEVVESPGHFEEFINAVKGEGETVSHFGYAGPLTETVVLGNLAVWANGPRLEWDARSQSVKGTDEYDELIHPQFREGWEL